MPEQVRESARPRSRPEAGQRRRVLEMAKGLSATLGKDFFRSLVQHLAETLGADCAYVGELTGAHEDRMRTLAVYRKDGELKDFEQGLFGTAPGRVLLDGVYTCLKGVAQAFPRDTRLASVHAQGYAGIRLSDSEGQPIGLLAAVSKERLADTRLIQSLLETFAPRTAAELERKRADDVLRENEERYHAFISTNPDGMWRLEFTEPIPLNLDEDEQLERIFRFGYIAECNDAAARQVGLESGQKMEGAPLEAILSRANTRVVEELRSSIRSGFRTATIETTPLDASGNLMYRLRSQFGIVKNGALRRIWVTTRDITGLRRAELSLAASERRFREVLEGVQLPAIMVDVHGAITFANECFLQLSQRSKEELRALNWLAGIVPIEEAAIWKSILQPGQSFQQATRHFEGTIVARDGGPQYAIEWSTIGLRDSEAGSAEIAAIGRDITHERALELEIRQSQKLDSIGKLASGVAHDFNNLLTVIVGHTAPLLNQVDESDPKRPHLAAIEDAASLCTKLTSQLLAFGRKQHLNPELIVLNETIASAEVIIHSLIGAGIEVKFDLQPELWRVYADATQMQRALANFVTNARDAMPQGGKLTISTSNLVIGTEDAAYAGMQPGNYVRLAVTDTGIGLSGEVRTHIFEPFFTTKGAGKGTGLGLATVYGAVAQSGGRIFVRSAPGKGATFEIVLPAR
jgi:two-component system, cell cycle sensor histidine kinase and response regulator CckA